jgi:S1-C subfamily serine protease
MAGLAALLLATATAVAQDEDKIHVKVARKVVPAVVFVEGAGQRGSGVIIDASGLILTSVTACGANSSVVTVISKGNRQHKGRVLGRDTAKELVLVKIDAPEPLPFVVLGDSDLAKIGQISYVFGDSFESLVNDDQPAMSLGAVSGLYTVDQKRGGSMYAGPVIETSAAVNPNQDGGPLVDREGRLLGIVTLNYDEAKFTGLAIPVNALKPSIEKIKKAHADGEKGVADVTERAGKKSDAWVGLETRSSDGGLEVTRVSKNGPADKAGVRKGDLLKRADGAPLATGGSLEEAVAGKTAGEVLTLTLVRDGERSEIQITVGRRPLF